MTSPQAFICPTCSAPLEAPNAQGFAHCRFCGAVVEPRVQAAPRPPTPPVRPQIYIQVQPFGAVRPPVVASPRPARGVIGIVGLVIGLTVVVPLLLTGVGAYSFRNVLSADVTKLPTVCTVNQTIDIKGVHFNGVGTAITAQDNCTINITSSDITATTVIRVVGANVHVNLTGATLAGTSDAVGLADNSHLHADGATKITSSASAISGVGANPEVTLDHTHVQGSVAGIDLADNARVVLLGADVRGATAIRANDNANVQMTAQAMAVGTIAGIVLQENADITIQGSTVQASGEAIKMGWNGTLNGSGAKITGGTAALDTKAALVSGNLSGSTVNGPRLVDGHPDPASAPHASPPQHPWRH